MPYRVTQQTEIEASGTSVADAALETRVETLTLISSGLGHMTAGAVASVTCLDVATVSSVIGTVFTVGDLAIGGAAAGAVVGAVTMYPIVKSVLGLYRLKHKKQDAQFEQDRESVLADMLFNSNIEQHVFPDNLSYKNRQSLLVDYALTQYKNEKPSETINAMKQMGASGIKFIENKLIEQKDYQILKQILSDLRGVPSFYAEELIYKTLPHLRENAKSFSLEETERQDSLYRTFRSNAHIQRKIEFLIDSDDVESVKEVVEKERAAAYSDLDYRQVLFLAVEGLIQKGYFEDAEEIFMHKRNGWSYDKDVPVEGYRHLFNIYVEQKNFERARGIAKKFPVYTLLEKIFDLNGMHGRENYLLEADSLQKKQEQQLALSPVQDVPQLME